MKKLCPIALAALLLLPFTACDLELPLSEAFLGTEDYCLEVNARMMHEFTATECQLGYNASKCQFRVGNDQMTEYYILECDKIPSHKDEILTVDLTWTMDATIQKRSGLRMKVSKIGDDGRIWLWSGNWDAVAAIVYKPVS